MVTQQELLEFERRIKAAERKAIDLTPQTKAQCERVIQEHRRRINDTLLSSAKDKEPIPAGQIRELQRSIEREVGEMSDQITEILREAETRAATLATESSKDIAMQIGASIQANFFAPTTEILSVTIGYSADLIRTISQDLLPKVNAILSQGAAGGISPFEAMKRIDIVIGKGGMRGVSYQAERIVRTEVQRIYSAVMSAQIQRFAEMVGGMDAVNKIWISGPNRSGRRKRHQQMDKQVVPADSDFFVPISLARLRYPRDPKGKANEVINCMCQWRLDTKSIKEAVIKSIVT